MQLRLARPSDRRAIVSFLKREDPEDYVIEWMDRFMSAGRFTLLVDGRKLGGLVHGKLAPDGSAWMSAARVGVDYRGQGWINRMNNFAFDTPGLRRSHAARMLITHDNTSSIRAAEKGGFRPVSTLSFMDWEAKRRRRAARPQGSGFVRAPAARFARNAKGARLIRQQRDLAYMSFNGAFAMTTTSAQVCSPWLFDSPKLGPIMAAMFPDTGERWMAVQPFASNASLAKGLLSFAKEQRADSMTVILPALAGARKPFAGEGYTLSAWAKRVLIFEKRLGRRPISSEAAPRTGRR